MAPPGGATSKRLDRPKKYLVFHWWRRLEVPCVSSPASLPVPEIHEREKENKLRRFRCVGIVYIVRQMVLMEVSQRKFRLDVTRLPQTLSM